MNNLRKVYRIPWCSLLTVKYGYTNTTVQLHTCLKVGMSGRRKYFNEDKEVSTGTRFPETCASVPENG